MDDICLLINIENDSPILSVQITSLFTADDLCWPPSLFISCLLKPPVVIILTTSLLFICCEGTEPLLQCILCWPLQGLYWPLQN